MGDAGKLAMDKRVMKSGNSLYVCIPNEVAEMWNLKKGGEVHIEVVEGALRIEPRRPSAVQTISEEQLEAFGRAMRGIEARVTMDTERCALELEFRGEDQESVKALVRNLWRNLPVLLAMLGVRTAEELSPTRPGTHGAGGEVLSE
ncbi:MAG: AbrB/MazE/SpoVT family DNA-binding domain-containing protein [Chloroflexota bacterium]|nr:AbrB/MazE/SpoVT family DNA-binding domain-containing protein [Chloroflexota bacterium]